MHDKVLVLVAYASLGIALALFPLWCGRLAAGYVGRRGALTPALPDDWTALLLALAGALLAVLRGTIGWQLTLAILVTALAASWLSRSKGVLPMLTCFFALYIATTLPWWGGSQGGLQVPMVQLGSFCIAALAFAAAFGREHDGGRGLVTWLVPYALVAAAFSFSTGVLSDDGALLTLWHHWGAYVGPAEAMLSGAVILRDIPLQYGLGPTLLIASACGADCWQGMYYIAGAATFLFALVIGAMGLALCRADAWQRVLASCACLAACFLWTAYPPDVSMPLMTPSSSGMRFLPVAVLGCYLFFQPRLEDSRWLRGVGHFLWAFGALWSPESAFYVTFVWWPYYLWIRVLSSRLPTLRSGARALLTLAGLALALVLAFVLVFRAVYGRSPSGYGYLAYLINPPGPMPINWHGTVLFFLMSTVLALLATYRLLKLGKDPLLLRRGFIVQLLSYATASYFLGRSHDNNLLNVLPCTLLTLLYAVRALDGGALRLPAIALLSGVIGWLPLFGWSAWEQAWHGPGVLAFSGSAWVRTLDWRDPGTADKIARRFAKFGLEAGRPSDAGAALAHIARTYGEPATVLDYSLDLVHTAPRSAWSAIHGPANFPDIPSEQRRLFLERTAKTLNRPGWLVVDRKFPADAWLADFAAVYTTTERLEFGTYYAVRMVPTASLKARAP
jgi:hypothetical protein